MAITEGRFNAGDLVCLFTQRGASQDEHAPRAQPLGLIAMVSAAGRPIVTRSVAVNAISLPVKSATILLPLILRESKRYSSILSSIISYRLC